MSCLRAVGVWSGKGGGESDLSPLPPEMATAAECIPVFCIISAHFESVYSLVDPT